MTTRQTSAASRRLRPAAKSAKVVAEKSGKVLPKKSLPKPKPVETLPKIAAPRVSRIPKKSLRENSPDKDLTPARIPKKSLRENSPDKDLTPARIPKKSLRENSPDKDLTPKKSQKPRISVPAQSPDLPARIPSSERSPELLRLDELGLEKICTYLSDGKSISEFCKEFQIPKREVQRWIAEDSERALSILAEKARHPRERLESIGIEAFCEYIAAGGSINAFTKSHGFWVADVHNWLADETRAKLYQKAREQRADRMAEEILSIVDDNTTGKYVDEFGRERIDTGAVMQARMRMDARKWIAGKFYPRVYGDKQIIAGDPDNPIGGVRTKADLTRLSDAELKIFMELQRKVTEGL